LRLSKLIIEARGLKREHKERDREKERRRDSLIAFACHPNEMGT